MTLLLTLGVSSAIAGSHGSTLDIVKERGFLKCGSNTGLAGFGLPNDAGVWEGIDVDVCRAVAAAVFGDASKVEYVPTTSKVRFLFFNLVKWICYQEIQHGHFKGTLS